MDVLPKSDDFSVVFNPGNRFLETSSIQRILAGLVTVDEQRTPSRDVVIIFAHSSVQDYLHSTGVVPASFRLDVDNGHSFIFKSCMAYISHYDETDGVEQKEPPYPLMEYACVRAGQHLKKPWLADSQKGWHRQLLLPQPPINQGKAKTLLQRFAAREHLTPGAFVFTSRRFLPFGFSFDDPQVALDAAASAGEPELVKLVLDSDAVQPSLRGMTALHTAALKRGERVLPGCGIPSYAIDYVAVVRELVRAGYLVNSVSTDGRTPLHVAAMFGNSDVASCLLQFGDVDVVAADCRGFTPLILAAARGHPQIVELLLNRQGVRADDVDEELRTALSWAAAGGHDEVVDVLLKFGHANPNNVDCRGRSALIWASSLGRATVVSRLLGVTGVQPDKRDILGRTALSWAALRGHRDTVSALLSRQDVTVNPIDNQGRDLYTLARSRGHETLSTADTAEPEVVGHFNAPAGHIDQPSPTLCSFRTATTSDQLGTTQVSNTTKSTDAKGYTIAFEAFELGNHPDEVWRVQFSNDGRQLVTCGKFNRVVIWDLTCRTDLFTLKGHRHFVARAAWSPDDSMLVTVGTDRSTMIWDADVSCNRSEDVQRRKL